MTNLKNPNPLLPKHHKAPVLTTDPESDYATTKKLDDDRRFEKRIADDRKIEGVRSLFETTDRILTGSVSLNLRIEYDKEKTVARAWTNGEDIWLGGNYLRASLATEVDDPRLFITSWKGVNLHEVGHVLFSPRQNSPYIQGLINHPKWDSTMKWASNVLEESRMEMLMISRFRPVRHYFNASTLTFIVETIKPWNQNHAYVLVCGRYYLDPEVRESVKALCSLTEKQVARVEEITDEYQRCVFPSDSHVALALVQELADILRSDKQQVPGDDPATSHLCVLGAKKGGNHIRDQKEAVSNLDNTVEVLDEEHEARAQEKAEEAESDEDALESPVKGDEGSDEGDDEEPEYDPWGDRPEPPEVPKPEVGDEKTQEAIDAAHEALADLYGDEGFSDDLSNTSTALRQAMGAGSGDDTVDVRYGKYQYMPIDHNYQAQDARTAVKKVVRSFTEIRQDLEPGWIMQQPTGKLNIQRAIHSRHGDMDLFDVWDEGAVDDIGVEMVVLLDLSTSMVGCIDQASVAAWVMKRSADILEIPCTIIGYSNGYVVLYKRGDKAAPGTYKLFNLIGGTTPYNAFRAASRQLLNSTEPNKMLVSITDGAWAGAPCEPIVRALNKRGVETMLFHIGGWMPDGHDHKIVKSVESVSDIPPIVEEAVLNILRRHRKA